MQRSPRRRVGKLRVRESGTETLGFIDPDSARYTPRELGSDNHWNRKSG